MTAQPVSLDRINFLLQGAAVARANALDGTIPTHLRRQWLEDADHMTACAERLLEQAAVSNWMTGLPAWELVP